LDRKINIDELIERFGRELFELKEEHIKLLRNACVRWDDCEFGAPAIDCKRPYGNTAVYEDIAEILDIKPVTIDCGFKIFSEDQKEWMRKIHHETKTALQIVLSTGKFESGLYECPKYFTRCWRKVHHQQP